MSLCGGMEKGGPTDEEFDQNIIKYSDVCENPSLFSSPNLVVRLNGKYYSWSAACPIVMTIITFQKPLTNKKTDVFDDDDVNDDDDDDDELQFSCSSDNDDDYNVASGNDDDNKLGYDFYFFL
uniref:Lipin middle domain-containing protein n=1 Tax=Megaselia scalaris TaxID=36166 RepID=T1GDY6_MEGSC